jgi:hypothetical protein
MNNSVDDAEAIAQEIGSLSSVPPASSAASTVIYGNEAGRRGTDTDCYAHRRAIILHTPMTGVRTCLHQDVLHC